MNQSGLNTSRHLVLLMNVSICSVINFLCNILSQHLSVSASTCTLIPPAFHPDILVALVLHYKGGLIKAAMQS